MKRESIADYQGKIPGCTHDDDPSNVGTPKPQWDVNHGYKIPKDGNDDACTSGHGADHCWTEYYLVEAAIEYFDWQPSGSAANCSADAHSSCSNAVGSLAQSCSTTGMTESNGWDWKIIDIAGQLSYGGGPSRTFGGSLTAGGSYTKSHSEVKYDLTQVCKTDSATVTCSWENPDGERKELCHQVWFADRVQHVWGQAQRVCNKCKGTAGVTVQQNTGDGKVCVRGQKEFEFRVPINKIVHCDGKCHDIESGLPKPENTPRMPFIPPHV
ncbi:hypothetical protein B0H66DRAFT_469938 [Apodospora peruviana]|uniref:Uncharacterized protein n=1 Tax=Apodospora peruviana TaxID=516989 RepID=A0AAE0ISV3_9PEZI|nr:hypothetical protein B0H66DRAFT_469938 [Apodospora peruviana]